MQADILREKFLDFFKSKGHKIVESDSLVPKDDPTVLFTPAGMNQFKREFLGYDCGFKRAATSQRCLRTDDLGKVGRTSSHHTFFEMLGNFSFGDYFKKEAIGWAWEFLTRELKIAPNNLWVSVYKDDIEAYEVWKDIIGMPVNKIVKLGDKDNFWPAEAKEKGPNGPCGPCSEIFYDFGLNVGCGEKACDPSCSCGRFVEIWNLVFTQFNRKEGGNLEPLPSKNIDTGMGLERLTAVMEGKQNNFETELFKPIIKEIMLQENALSPKGAPLELSYYAIADHIRAVAFSIYDGITPSNEGRGYVVRKIIRKSVLHLRELGIDKPFLNKLVPIVAEIMHKPYPDLKEKQESIACVVLNEEANFINTLKLSGVLVEKEIEKVKSDLKNAPKKDGFTIASAPTSGALGIAAFRLYDTNGIPLEIIKDELKIKFIEVDADCFEAAYQKELKKQKNLSKSSSKMKGDVFDAKGLGLKLKESKFAGYGKPCVDAKIEAVLKDNKEVKEGLQKEELQIILDKTCFYPESGGQVGDTGELVNGDNRFEVVDTQKIDNLILHIGRVKSGAFKKGDSLVARIDTKRRLSISRNHTATHILQAALRKILGAHVQQQGSLVREDKFRFDFTHFKGLSKDELKRIEELANEYVEASHNVEAEEMELKDAKKTKALAFFGDKYGEWVRVVSVGDISMEFCGGAHLKNTKEIGLIKITGEGSVASGIRRIEGVTGDYARKFIEEEKLRLAKESKKKEEIALVKEKEKQENAEVNKTLQELALKIAGSPEKINGINLISCREDGLGMNALRRLMDLVKDKAKLSVVVLGSKDQEKAFLVVGVSADLIKEGFDALVLIKQAAPVIGGSGGGRKDFAQAGGSNPENFALAFNEIKGIIKNLKREDK